MARKSNTPSAELVAQVRALVGDDGLTNEQISRVIVAYQAAHAGATLGTVAINPATNAVAKRVSVGGVHQWKVIDDDGGVSFDTRPDLEGWEVARRPQPASGDETQVPVLTPRSQPGK